MVVCEGVGMEDIVSYKCHNNEKRRELGDIVVCLIYCLLILFCFDFGTRAIFFRDPYRLEYLMGYIKQQNYKAKNNILNN